MELKEEIIRRITSKIASKSNRLLTEKDKERVFTIASLLLEDLEHSIEDEADQYCAMYNIGRREEDRMQYSIKGVTEK